MGATTDATLKALAAACPAARPAEPGDAVAGVMPRYAASPASVAEASALLTAAAGDDLTVVARGSGSRLDWGAAPRRCDLVVDTLRMNQVIEHAAGDLVARVQAGVGLAQLGEVLAGAGQQLALDRPAGGNGQQGAGTATIGGTLATGMAGPRRLRYGTPRDLVIGITVVRADGTVASSGGKVVKNVAGYDLGKLFAGSYGTLGLIVEAVFRLHPLPAAAAYTTVDGGDAAGVSAAVAAVAASELAPTAVEISRVARGHPVRLGVLLEGDPGGVGERSALLCDLLGPDASTAAEAPGWWGRTGTAGTVIRFAFWAAALPQIMTVIDTAAAAAGLDPVVAGSAAAGVIYATLGQDVDPVAVAGFVGAVRAALAAGEGDARPAPAPRPDSPTALASAVVLRAPAPVRDLIDPWGPVPGLPLMRAVKDQFDPGHRMAPGRFAGGI
jgi:glycolate dehydrogenase FAD-binding subunit